MKNIVSKCIKEISIEELVELINWLKENIGEEKEISFLIKLNPQTIVIFRVLYNLTSHSFSRKLNINFSSPGKAEKGNRIMIGTLENWSEKIKEN